MARASFYRALKTPRVSTHYRRSHFRRIPDDQRQQILTTMNSVRFSDMSPPEIYATSLDEGTYLCSIRTMYRILKENLQNIQRRQSAHRYYKRPELLAIRPNQLWSWDITKLMGPAKWTYYYLYKIIDVFSRYVVGWMVAYRESATLAQALIADTCLKQEILPGTLTVHADNGPSMTSRLVVHLLADLGITKTHSRPHVSNDNPFSEAAFKTLKYRPDFPERFGSIEDARRFCMNFFWWYNQEHHHSGIALLTPVDLHYGRAKTIVKNRISVINQAFMEHPERFVKGQPVIHQPPTEVWINKPIFKEQPINVSLNSINNLSHSY
jgi:putative transposase